MNGSEETIQKKAESTPPEKPRKMPDLQKQIDKNFHIAKMQLAGPITFVFGMFVLGVIQIFRQNTRTGIVFCIIAVALIPLVIYVINFANKKVAVPDKLKNYIASFSPEQFFSARDMEHLLPNQQPGIIELSHPMEYQQENRYGILQPCFEKSIYIIFAIPLGLAVPALFTHSFWPILFLSAAGIAFLVAGLAFFGYYYSAGEMTVFDFHEKKILYGRCRRFRPENTGKMKSVSFSEIDHLSLALFEIERHTKSGTVIVKYISLLAVKSDGDCIPLCKASKYHLPRLLALAPDLAEKMGHLLITHF